MPIDTTATDYRNAVDMLALFSDATNRLAELGAELNRQQLDLVDDHREEYSKLQDAIARSEEALRLLALKNPDWFEGKRTVKTPYGKLKFTTSSKLVIANPDTTLALIANEPRVNPAFDAKFYVREVREPKREALELLDDATLERFKVRRVKDETFKVEPATVDMGAAVKSADSSKLKEAA